MTAIDSWTLNTRFLSKVAQLVRSNLSFSVLLCDPDQPLSKTSLIEDIIGSEVAQTTGYAPQLYVPGLGTYDSTDKRHEYPIESVTFTASSNQSINFSWVILWQGRGALGNTSILSIDTLANTVQLDTAIALTNNTPVMFESDGTLPTNLTQGTLFYARPTTTAGAHTIHTSTDPNLDSQVEFTNSGTGNHRLKVAAGDVVAVRNWGATTIPAGQSMPLNVSFILADGGGDAQGVI